MRGGWLRIGYAAALLVVGISIAGGEELIDNELPAPSQFEDGTEIIVLDHPPGDLDALEQALECGGLHNHGLQHHGLIRRGRGCGGCGHCRKCRNVEPEPKEDCGPCGGCNKCKPDEGEIEYTIGIERVPIALLELETAATLGKRDVMRVRLDGFYNWQNPDRLEYLWAKSQALGGKGVPFNETHLDFQDLRICMIRSGEKFQLGTDMGFRTVNPEVNGNTVGIADMSILTKTVMMDGEKFKLSTIFNTYLPTGYFIRGLGTGHVSMEQGFVGSYRYNAKTYFHAQGGYWFSIGADPQLKGQMVHYGLGLSHILYDHPIEDRAVIGLLEFEGWSIQDGGEHDITGAFRDLDPETIMSIHPGVRFILGEKIEVGAGFGLAVSNAHFFEDMFRLELRWMH